MLKPLHEVVVAHLSASHTRYDFHYNLVALDEVISASLRQQLGQVEGRPLVPVHKTVVGDDPVKQRCRLLVDSSMVTVVGPGNCRLYRIRVENSRGAALPECFVVATNCIGPCDSVMCFSDLPAPSSLHVA